MTDKQKPAVVIIDAFSTGKFFPVKLYNRGYDIIHVVSTPDMSPVFRSEMEETKKKLGDIFSEWLVSDNDPEDIAEKLKGCNIIAVIPAADSGVEFAEALSELLNLPGNGKNKRAARKDKFLMQKALTEAGVPTMAYHEAESEDDLLKWAEKLGKWPIVIKPNKGAATVGVHICRNEEELKTAWKDLAGTSDLFGNKNNTVLAEEYLKGTEYIVNTVSYNGRHLLTDFWVYKKIYLPGISQIYDYARLLPYPEPGDPLYEIISYTLSTLEALEVTNGPTHTEIMVTESGPRLIETNLRVMGGSLPPDLMDDCIGQNQVDLAIDSYVNPEKFMGEIENKYTIKNHLMMKVLRSGRSGQLKEIPLLDLLCELPSVHSGNLVHLIESGNLEDTIDLQTAPGLIFLRHPVEDVLLADYRTISDLEDLAQDRLYELDEKSDENSGIDSVFRESLKSGIVREQEDCISDAELIFTHLNLKGGEEFLSCPCNDREMISILAEKGLKITGIDNDAENVRTAREKFKADSIPGEFLNLDLNEMAFENRFDIILTGPGHFNENRDPLILNRYITFLRPGGKLVVEAPVYTGEGSDLQGEQSAGAYSSVYRIMMIAGGLGDISIIDEKGRDISEDSERMFISGIKP